MDPVTTSALVGAGLNLVGGLFGGNKRPSNPYTGKLNTSYRNLNNNVRPQWQQFGTRANTTYNTYAPQSTSANNSLISLLKKDPYTDEYSTRILQQSEGDSLRDKMRLQSEAAARFAGSGNDGLQAGTMANIDNNYLRGLAQNRNNLAMQRVQGRDSQAVALQQLLQALTRQAQGDELTALQGQQGIDSELTQLFAGLGQQATARGDAMQQAQGMGQASSMGELGTLLAYLLSQKTDPAMRNMKDLNAKTMNYNPTGIFGAPGTGRTGKSIYG